MLRRLSVENYALIEGLDMELSPNLNIITGETGAGKSILLGALGLVVGNRADTAALKDNNRNCVVEGIFEVDNYGLEPFFTQNDIDYSPETVVRRIITPSGKSRAYVNDVPVQLSVLKELGVRLIDIHSQHQTLMLGDEGFRKRVVDAVADNAGLTVAYAELYRVAKAAEEELARLRREAEEGQRDRDYIEYQYNQLAALKLHAGELQELESEQTELANVERIGEALGSSLDEFDRDEDGVLSRLKRVETAFEKLQDVYKPASEIASRVRSAAIDLRDLKSLLAEELERVEADPERLSKVVERLDAIYSLLQKHKVSTVEELLELQSGWEVRLRNITSSGEQVAAAERKLAETQEQLQAAASKLTAARRKAASFLGAKVKELLARLAMEKAHFECVVTPLGFCGPDGADAVDFMFASSDRLSPQPLEKIASGGETSRVMLCLKAVVADKTDLPTIVFDEIDTGVSGRIADVTGQIIYELSANRQVVNITHLPQVASKGSTHFRVFKDVQGRTRIAELLPEERVEEVAKMLSGNEVTEAAVNQAKVLLGAR